MLEWGSDPNDYRGWMTVSAENGQFPVIVHLSFAGRSGYPERIEASTSEPDLIDHGLEASLDSIRHLLEGLGGKVVPSGADA